MNNKTMNVIKIVTLAAFVAWVVIAGINYSNANASSSGLKVIVKLKYSDWIKAHGMGKAYFHYYDDSEDAVKNKDLSKKFPKEVTLQFPSGAVDVGEGFTVILNSYKCDDATEVSGTNSPGKSPETVKMRFPC
jgi:hypothetical protein